MNDRVPTQPNRVKITKSDGTSEYVTWERADLPTQEGTPINKATLFSSANSERYDCDLPSEALALLGTEWTVSVPSSGWSTTTTNGWYTNQVTVSGMKAVYNPIASVVITSATTAEDEATAFGIVKEIETFDGYVICKALSIPADDFTLRMAGV